MTDGYPDIPEHPAKAWDYAPLHMCSSRRMLGIGKDYGLSGISSLKKEDLFVRIYDHMFQLDSCETCGGTCKPDEHMWPPIADKPTSKEGDNVSPNNSPTPSGRNTRQSVDFSPSRMAAIGDNSSDNPLGGGQQPLFPGQPETANMGAGSSASLADRISTGSGTYTDEEIDIEAELVKDAQLHQKAIDRKEEEEKQRRINELAKVRKSKETKAQILERRKREQREAMQAAANKRHKAQELAHKRALEAEKSKPARPTSSHRSTETSSATSKRKRSSSRHVGFVKDNCYPDSTPDQSSDDEVFDAESDEDPGPFTTKALVKYMSQSFAKALDRQERMSSRRVSIQDADINNASGVPEGAPSSGKMVLQPVANSAMAARLGLAPTPNLVIDGDPSNLDPKKIHKHMQSGSKRTLGQFVSRQVNWPEEFLSPGAPGHGKVEFKNLSFTEFIDGMLAKCMLETPQDRMDDELANKLTFLREVVAMHYSLGLKDVLAVTERFLRGWESQNFEWNDWPQIQIFLRESKYQQMCTALTNRIHHNNGGGGGAGKSGGGGGAPTPKGGSHVYGIPTDFLRSNKLCINYNKDACDEKGDHPQPHNKSGVILFHKCAGCMKNGVTPEKEHCVKKCPKGPYKAPSRA